MLKKSPASARILAAACAGVVFVVLLLFQPAALGSAELGEVTLVFGLVLYAVTTFAFFTLIARCDERYYGPAGLAGWLMTGLLMALSLVWVQRIYPSTFGLIGVMVIGFIVFRWLSFWLVWKAAGLFKT